MKLLPLLQLRLQISYYSWTCLSELRTISWSGYQYHIFFPVNRSLHFSSYIKTSCILKKLNNYDDLYRKTYIRHHPCQIYSRANISPSLLLSSIGMWSSQKTLLTQNTVPRASTPTRTEPIHLSTLLSCGSEKQFREERKMLLRILKPCSCPRDLSERERKEKYYDQHTHDSHVLGRTSLQATHKLDSKYNITQPEPVRVNGKMFSSPFFYQKLSHSSGKYMSAHTHLFM